MSSEMENEAILKKELLDALTQIKTAKPYDSVVLARRISNISDQIRVIKQAAALKDK